MSIHGSRFDREFTPDDLAIVNMGYWDPNADEDSEQADSAPVEVAETVETESSKPAEADAEPADYEVAAAPLGTEVAEKAEDAETVEDSDNSEIPEESQETAPRESKKPEAKSVAKSAKIPAELHRTQCGGRCRSRIFQGRGNPRWRQKRHRGDPRRCRSARERA